MEIVAIPKFEEREIQGGLFSLGNERVNVLLSDWAQKQTRVLWIKPGQIDLERIIHDRDHGRAVPWQLEADGLYWRGLLPEKVKLDLFITTPEKFPVVFAVRTGSAEFSKAMMTHAKYVRHTPIEQGRVLNYDRLVDIKDERHLFDYLGLEWVEPEQRMGRDAIRPR